MFVCFSHFANRNKIWGKINHLCFAALKIKIKIQETGNVPNKENGRSLLTFRIETFVFKTEFFIILFHVPQTVTRIESTLNSDISDIKLREKRAFHLRPLPAPHPGHVNCAESSRETETCTWPGGTFTLSTGSINQPRACSTSAPSR